MTDRRPSTASLISSNSISTETDNSVRSVDPGNTGNLFGPGAVGLVDPFDSPAENNSIRGALSPTSARSMDASNDEIRSNQSLKSKSDDDPFRSSDDAPRDTETNPSYTSCPNCDNSLDPVFEKLMGTVNGEIEKHQEKLSGWQNYERLLTHQYIMSSKTLGQMYKGLLDPGMVTPEISTAVQNYIVEKSKEQTVLGDLKRPKLEKGLRSVTQVPSLADSSAGIEAYLDVVGLSTCHSCQHRVNTSHLYSSIPGSNGLMLKEAIQNLSSLTMEGISSEAVSGKLLVALTLKHPKELMDSNGSVFENENESITEEMIQFTGKWAVEALKERTRKKDNWDAFWDSIAALSDATSTYPK